MTVNTTTSRADYTGNGVTTAFTVPFYFLDNTHLTVLRTVIATGVSTTLVLGTDYTVTGAGVPAGGTVTCTVAPTAAQKISILRNVPFTQLTDYVPNDPFPAESHERALDQLTMLAQQVNENLSRSIALPAATTGISTSLPTAQPLQLLGFNAAGSALTTYDPTSLLTVAGSSGFSTQTFNGTGAQTAFTLSTSPGAIANLEVFISGVRQRPTTDYTLSGSTLTFVSGAPAVGTGNIFVRWGTTLGIGVPSDTSVTTTKIADGNVTTAKIADANVTTAKIADGSVTNAKLATQPVAYNGGTAGGTANALTLTIAGATVSSGTTIVFKPSATNTGATTVNINGAGAVSVVKPGTSGTVSCVGGEIVNGAMCVLVYDGTNYVITSLIASSPGKVLIAVRTFTTSQTPYVPTTGTTAVLMQLIGGGGSGGYPGGVYLAGGGGGGGFAEVYLTSGFTGINLTIGAGGTVPAFNTRGNTGGTTTFGSYSASGGEGGNWNNGITTSPWAAGGTANGNVRSITGSPGMPTTVGHGGASGFGGGGGVPTTTTGGAGTNGGGGAGGNNNAPGAGGAGYAIVYEFA